MVFEFTSNLPLCLVNSQCRLSAFKGVYVFLHNRLLQAKHQYLQAHSNLQLLSVIFTSYLVAEPLRNLKTLCFHLLVL